MARPLRIEFAGALYHVTSRGDGRENIVLNPVRARMVRAARDWPRSNYRATAGLRSAPKWLETDCSDGRWPGR